LLAVACGSTAEPVIVEKEVIREVIKEVPVIKEVIKEVVKEVIVEKEVIKEVVREVMVIATPAPIPAMAMGRPAYVDIGESHHYNGVFPLMAIRNPGFWDVHYGGSLNTVLTPSSPRFNGLVEYNPENPTEIIGDLAETWELNEAGDVYTFRLKDATWSKGRGPVTADDIVWTLNRITDPDALRARTGYLRTVADQGNFKAIDAKTVEVKLNFPTATFIPNLATDYFKMYPKALEGISQDDLNCCPEKSFGSGPWIFKSWKKDNNFEFEKNETYFKSGRPFFDGLKIFIVRDASRRLAAYQAGQVFGSYLPWTSANTPWDMVQLEKDTEGRMRASVLNGVGIAFMWLNNSQPPFDDPNVRKAIYIGLDRAELGKTAYRGFGVPGTFFSPGFVEDSVEFTKANLPGYRANPADDVAEAKALLTAAGFPDGLKDIKLNSLNAGPSKRAAEAFSAQMRRDGLADITLDAVDLATMYVKMRDGTHAMSMVNTGIIITDPGDIINQFFLQNVLRNPENWSDPRTDALMTAQNLEQDPVKRRALIKEFADVLHEGTSHVVPMWWNSSGATFDYRLRNWHAPMTVQLVHKWDHVWFDPDAKKPTTPGYVP
jgi:ABC-type transport system substrate-binding protein